MNVLHFLNFFFKEIDWPSLWNAKKKKIKKKDKREKVNNNNKKSQTNI